MDVKHTHTQKTEVETSKILPEKNKKRKLNNLLLSLFVRLSFRRRFLCIKQRQQDILQLLFFHFVQWTHKLIEGKTRQMKRIGCVFGNSCAYKSLSSTLHLSFGLFSLFAEANNLLWIFLFSFFSPSVCFWDRMPQRNLNIAAVGGGAVLLRKSN